MRSAFYSTSPLVSGRMEVEKVVQMAVLVLSLLTVSSSATEHDSIASSTPVPAPISSQAEMASLDEIRLQNNGKIVVTQHGTTLRGTGTSIIDLGEAHLEVDGEILILSAPKLVQDAPKAESSAHGRIIRAVPQCISISAFGTVKLTFVGAQNPIVGQSAACRIQQHQWFVDGKPVGSLAN